MQGFRFPSCRGSEGCRSLEYLNLSWCDQITKDGIEALVRGCRGLKALLLRGCTQVWEPNREGTSPARGGPCCPLARSPGSFRFCCSWVFLVGFSVLFCLSLCLVRRRSSETHSELLPGAREPQLTVLLRECLPLRALGCHPGPPTFPLPPQPRGAYGGPPQAAEATGTWPLATPLPPSPGLARVGVQR